MSAICDFYIECSEKNLCPVEDRTAIPPPYKRKRIVVENRWGDPIEVDGVSVADAIRWCNSDLPLPGGMREFLRDFAGCERCDTCGATGYSHYFVYTGETLCPDCS
jgi:hypothetical protein